MYTDNMNLQGLRIYCDSFDGLAELTQVLLALPTDSLTVGLINPSNAITRPRRTLTIHKTRDNELGFKPQVLWHFLVNRLGQLDPNTCVDTRVDGFAVTN